MVSLALYLAPRQNEVFIPRPRQAVRLLQISTQGFNQELMMMLSANPFLDRTDEWHDCASEEDTSDTEEETSMPEIQFSLKLVQSLDPSGVGSR